MESLVVDCSEVRSQADFWRLYLRMVRPEGAEHFGSNLEAFRDAVLGGGPGWPGDRTLRFTGSAHMSAIQNGEFLAKLKLIAEASDGDPEIRFE
ncbi:barstar family protein [Leucobacter insecticola]|uniref:barstar family protein n=1 Tax=Leucobacter insecticola TaxID=2714934 RepID=UPI003CC78F16